MAYTVIDKPSDYFNTVLYTGNNTSQSITGVGFQPDWVWLKERNGTEQHNLYDSVRGVYKRLMADANSLEYSSDTQLTAFGSDGFSVGSSDAINDAGNTMVAWNWRAGTAFTNDASSTSIGTLDSAGSSNQEAGFSIVSYTSNGSSNQSVAHNLGGVPEMIISKNRDSTSASYNYWTVYHHSLATANDKKLKLNTTDAASTTNEWGDTDPTSTVYSLHTSGDGTTNHSTDKMISYCFRSIKGYSKFSSYIGNGQDTPNGVFTYLGFTPAFILIKATDSNSWVIVDDKRPADPNPVDSSLAANSSDAETTGDSNTTFDFLSNGFRTNGNSGNNNSSGQEYIFMAFASSPFTTSTGIPATAK